MHASEPKAKSFGRGFVWHVTKVATSRLISNSSYIPRIDITA